MLVKSKNRTAVDRLISESDGALTEQIISRRAKVARSTVNRLRNGQGASIRSILRLVAAFPQLSLKELAPAQDKRESPTNGAAK